jgi:hypothetical protein
VPAISVPVRFPEKNPPLKPPFFPLNQIVFHRWRVPFYLAAVNKTTLLMNLNVKLVPSALGLVIGLAMLAAGGPEYGVVRTKNPGNPASASQKVNGKTAIRKKPGRQAVGCRTAFVGKQTRDGQLEWPIESYK